MDGVRQIQVWFEVWVNGNCVNIYRSIDYNLEVVAKNLALGNYYKMTGKMGKMIPW